MGAKEYSIAFAIAGKLSESFAKTFKGANDAVQGFSGHICELNKQAANIGNVLKLRKETFESTQCFATARQKVTELGRNYAMARRQSELLADQYGKAKRSLASYTASLNKHKSITDADIAKLEDKERELAELSKKLKAAEVSEKKLGAQFDKERVAINKTKPNRQESSSSENRVGISYGRRVCSEFNAAGK